MDLVFSLSALLAFPSLLLSLEFFSGTNAHQDPTDSASIPVPSFDFTIHKRDEQHADISPYRRRRPKRECLLRVWLREGKWALQALFRLHRVCDLWWTSKINAVLTRGQALSDHWDVCEWRVRFTWLDYREVVQLNYSYNTCPLALKNVHSTCGHISLPLWSRDLIELMVWIRINEACVMWLGFYIRGSWNICQYLLEAFAYTAAALGPLVGSWRHLAELEWRKGFNSFGIFNK